MARPFHRLDHIGLSDDASDSREHLAAPVVQRRDAGVDEGGGGGGGFCFRRGGVGLLQNGVGFFAVAQALDCIELNLVLIWHLPRLEGSSGWVLCQQAQDFRLFIRFNSTA